MRIRCLLMVIVLVSFVASCKEDTQSGLRLSGRLVGSTAKGMVVLELGSGEISQYPIRRAYDGVEVLCQGPNGLVLAKSGNVVLGGPTKGDSYTGATLFQFDPRTGTLERLELPNIPAHFISTTLDFDPVANRYLFIGRYDSLEGIFVLDSTFAILKNLGQSFLGATEYPDWGTAYFVPEGFVFTHDDKVKILNTVAGDVSAVPGERLYQINRERNRLIVDSHDDNHLLVDLTDMSTRQITANPNAVSFAFSPDSKYLAFATWEGFPEKSMINFYDLEQGKIIGRKRCVLGSFVWVE